MVSGRILPAGLAGLRKTLADPSGAYRMSGPRADGPDHGGFWGRLRAAPDEARRALAFLPARGEVEALICLLPQYLQKHPDAELSEFLCLRYRRYVFRAMYLVWQDHYLNPAFCALFARLFDHPKSPRYLEECGYRADELKDIVLSESAGQAVLTAGRQSPDGLAEYLRAHYISKGSQLALDVMSVYFLYCSEQDYLEIGDARLFRVVGRYSEHSQVKLLRNMLRRISPGNLARFSATLRFFAEAFYMTPRGERNQVWEVLGDYADLFRSLAEGLREPAAP